MVIARFFHRQYDTEDLAKIAKEIEKNLKISKESFKVPRNSSKKNFEKNAKLWRNHSKCHIATNSLKMKQKIEKAKNYQKIVQNITYSLRNMENSKKNAKLFQMSRCS